MLIFGNLNSIWNQVISLNDQLSYDAAKVKVSPLNKHTQTRWTAEKLEESNSWNHQWGVAVIISSLGYR